MRRSFSCLLLGMGLLLSSCGNADAGQTAAAEQMEAYTAELFAMDTVMSLTAYGPQGEAALQQASEEIQRLDALFSISSTEGDILPLNETEGGTVSADTAALLTRAIAVSELTGGLFDCTIAPVMEAWGFPSGNYHIPDAAQLQELLERVDYRSIRMDGNAVTLENGAQVDLGGIAKGFTSDRIMQLFADSGVSAGIVSLGGNVQTLGYKLDGSRWRVAIQDPVNTEETFAVVEVADQAVITSGGYQRYFEQDGQRYHHIIDHRTGYPADSGLISVTIVSSEGTLADGLSTALFIMGREQAIAYWQQHRDTFDAVLVSEDGTVTITEGLEDCFTLSDGGVPEVAH